MTPEQKEAFRREVLEEAAAIFDRNAETVKGLSGEALQREYAASVRALAASQPAPAADTGQAVAWLTEWQFHPSGPNVKSPSGGSSITRDAADAASKLQFYQTWDHVDWVRQTPLFPHPAPLDAEHVRELEAALERIAELKPERDSSSEYNRGWEHGRYQARSIANAALRQKEGK